MAEELIDMPTPWTPPDDEPELSVGLVDPKRQQELLVRAKIAQVAERVVDEAKAAVVMPSTLPAAYERLKEIRGFRKDWAGLWDPHIEAAMERKRKAEADRKKVVEDKNLRDAPLTEAENIWAQKIGACEDAAALAAVEDQKRLQAASDAAANERALAEAVALTEAAKNATPAEAAYYEAEAEAILAEPVVGPVVTVASVKPTHTGVSIPLKWSAEVFNLTLLMKALLGKKLDKVLTGELTTRILEAVQVPLNQRAVALKTALTIPGVRAKSERAGARIR